MNAHLDQRLKNQFDEMSDAVCEAIALHGHKDPEPPAALFTLDGMLKSERLRKAFALLHESQASEHTCCIHDPAPPLELHRCCLPANAAQVERTSGSWVLQRAAGGEFMYLARDEDGAERWADALDPRLVRFEEEGMARIFRAWHFRGDDSVAIEQLRVEAA